MAEASTVPKEKKMTHAQRKALRPLQILDAAFEEFVKNGYSAARLEDVARRADITKGTVYVYFETKEHLFKAVFDHASASFQEALKNYPRTGDPVEELKAFFEFLFDRIVDDRKIRELFRIVVAEAPRFPDLMERHREVFIEPVLARTTSILEEGVLKKKFRAKPAEHAKVVMSPLVGMVFSRLILDDRRTVGKTVVLSSQLELLFRGLLER